jgi:PAS domain S-box-containing protein
LPMFAFFNYLRVRLVLIVLLAVLPALGGVLYSGLEQRRLAREEAKGDLLSIVRQISYHEDDAIEGVRQLLLGLSRVPLIHQDEPVGISSLFADILAKQQSFGNLGIIDPEGVVLASALPLTQRVNLGDRSYFKRAVERRDFAVGDFQRGRITGKLEINCAYPLLDHSGQLQRVIYASLNLDWLNRLLTSLRRPEGSQFTLMDSRGVIMLSVPDSKSWIGKQAPNSELLRAILAQGEGVVEGSWNAGSDELIAFTPVGSNPRMGFLVASIPKAITFAPANHLLARNLIWLEASLSLALLGAWMLGYRFVVRRISVLAVLAAKTQQVGEGDLTVQSGLSYGPDEISQLAKNFDRMTTLLKAREQERQEAEEALTQANAELEERVLERTADIRRAHDEVQEAKDKLKTLIEASPLAIISIDTQGCLTSWNTAAERIFGWRQEEVLGKPLPLIREEDRGLFEEKFQEQLAGNPFIGEWICLKKDGSPADVEVISALLRDSEGKIIGSMGILEDVTESKKFEQALRKSEEQLRQAQKIEAVGKLAGGVAHDFNNILTAISGQSELLLMDLRENDPRQLHVQVIQQAADRAASLTRQLLAFSRKQINQPKVLDLNELILNPDKMLRRLIPEDVQIMLIPGSNLGKVFTDPGQIEQVIVNLAVNARDAMPQGGKLLIETSNAELDEEYCQRHPQVKPGPYVTLAVSDTGIGMDSETQSHIFEPFFTTKEMGKGTGLGLSMVYGIVKQNSGHIWVYSKPRHGTTFKIYFPMTVKSVEKIEAPPICTLSFKGSETILLLEDEDIVLEITKKMLQREGYAVLSANKGSDALVIGEQHQGSINLILSDVLMPDMSAPETVERLMPMQPNAKVLYMSGHTENAIVHHGVLDPGLAFIQKPFRRVELLGKVRGLLDTFSEK